MKAQTRCRRIIHNASIVAHRRRPFLLALHATKARRDGLTKSTSLDLRKYTSAAARSTSGNAATEMTERMKNGVPAADGTTMVEPRNGRGGNVGSAVVLMAPAAGRRTCSS